MKTLIKILLASIHTFAPICAQGQDKHRWSLEEEGHISWQLAPKETHHDHIEMSGKTVSVVLRYGVENGKLEVIVSNNGKNKKHIIKDGETIKVKL